ncbi:MAG: hypothetical protein HYZ14_15995 [Bacteroidetes bacterium]|nr:hypothetical protein [Bacteroidota bacterium]
MTPKQQTTHVQFFSGPEKRVAVILFAGLWAYLFLRAVYVPLLHDEIATFFYYVQSDVYLPPKAHWDANNHVLNSMLTNWSYHLFGQSPLALRLPNVLSFALFFAGAYGISARLKKPLLRWGLLTSLVMSSYIFEYLAESRGYGMSLAFLLTAVFMLIRLIETNRAHFVLLTGLFLFLATAANLTMLISSLLIFIFIFLHAVYTDLKTNKKKLLLKCGWLLLTGTPFLALAALSLKLKKMGLLYYGSKAGFTVVTMPSLLKQFFGFSSAYLVWFFVLVSVAISVIAVTVFFRNRANSKLPGFFTYLLAGSVLFIFMLAHFAGVNYPEDRTAMYLYVYFIAALYFVLDVLSEKRKYVQLAGLLAYVVPVFFVLNISLTGSVFSSEERHSQKLFDLINERAWTSKFPPTVGGYRTQEFCWFYMNNTAGGKQGRLHWTNHPGLDADFELVSTQFRFNPQTYAYYDSIYRDDATGLVLFERKHKLNRTLIQVTDIPVADNTTTGFYNLGKYELDTLRNSTLYIGAEMTLESPSQPFTARLVAGVDNAAGENIVYEYIPLHWLRRQYTGEENNVLQGTLIHHVPEEAVSMTFYLWNINEKPFSIRNGKCYLYSLERDF